MGGFKAPRKSIAVSSSRCVSPFAIVKTPSRNSEEANGSPAELPDGILARRVQNGDNIAFEALARRYMRPVHAVIASVVRVREDVDDAVQETFLRVLDRIHTYNPGRPFAPWFYQVARNVARNHVKRSGRRDREEPAELAEVAAQSEESDPEKSTELVELRLIVARSIDALPERQRAAFRLHDIDGFSAPEIAEMLGVSAGAVRANVFHARRALRRRLEPYHLRGYES